MRNFVISIIFLGGVGYFGSILCERMLFSEDGTEQVEVEAVGHGYVYPENVVIKSADGREMMVTLLGRSASHIQFIREDDGQEFVYPINSLDLDAQALVSRYPNVGIQNGSEYLEKGSLEVSDLYLQEMEKSLRKIDEKIQDLSRAFAGCSGNTERRTLRREMERLEVEKVKLQRKISGR